PSASCTRSGRDGSRRRRRLPGEPLCPLRARRAAARPSRRPRRGASALPPLRRRDGSRGGPLGRGVEARRLRLRRARGRWGVRQTGLRARSLRPSVTDSEEGERRHERASPRDSRLVRARLSRHAQQPGAAAEPRAPRWHGEPCPAITGSVDDALRLGCAAIGFTIYPGSNLRNTMYEEIRALGEEAKQKGLAVVVWSYPRGSGLSKEGETAIDVVAYAAQIACQLGAHVVKVKLPAAHIE